MTNKNYTNEILGGYLMNNDRLNTEYLFLQVDIHTSNTEKLYKFMMYAIYFSAYITKSFFPQKTSP